MDCYLCEDKGIIQYNQKNDWGVYQYFAKCTCKHGRELQGFPSIKACLLEGEIIAIENRNKLKMMKAEKGVGEWRHCKSGSL